MVNEGLVPCGEEEMKRRNAIDKLKKVPFLKYNLDLYIFDIHFLLFCMN